MPRVVMRRYSSRSSPSRLAAGDIIRCPDFRSGLRWSSDPSGEMVVAWQDPGYPAYHAKVGNGTEVTPSRSKRFKNSSELFDRLMWVNKRW